MATTIQLKILSLLPRYPQRLGTRAIADKIQADGYSVSLRTVQRNLANLASAFEIDHDGDNPAGWFWKEKAELQDLPTLDPNAALTFSMVERHMAPMLPETCLGFLAPHFRRARKVLDDLGPSGIAYWPSRVARVSRAFSLNPPHIASEVLTAVYEGLLQERCLQLSYTTRGQGQEKEGIVHPLGVVFVDQVVYLVCTFWDYSDVRQLALHRIRDVKVLDEKRCEPEGFDLERYIDRGNFGFPVGDTPMRFKALVESWIADHLEESPLSEDQKLTHQQERGALVEATVLDTHQFRWWLLGFGDQVEVLEPKHIRDEMGRIARGMADLYEEGE